MDVEREGQKLLAMLELGVASASTYVSPSGAGTRDADTVRAAMAELRDPCRRLVHELWAALPADTPSPAQGKGDGVPGAGVQGDGVPEDPRGPWPEAFRAVGWRR